MVCRLAEAWTMERRTTSRKSESSSMMAMLIIFSHLTLALWFMSCITRFHCPTDLSQAFLSVILASLTDSISSLDLVSMMLNTSELEIVMM